MMRNLFILLFVCIVLPCSAQRRISIFCDHIGEIAKQEHISFTEAASKVKNLGYNGVDVSVNLSDKDQRTLDSLGFQHASAISHIDFYQGEKKDECRQALDFMHKNGYSRLLLVPGLRPKNAGSSADEVVFKRIKQFVNQAQQEGLEVMVEDFDNVNSPCYNTATLDRLFKAVPQLNLVLDTGNFPFAGEDDIDALHHFRNKIQHLHLKDRKKMKDRESLAIGTGIVSLQDIITELLKTGYSGWFTVECYGAKNMLNSATTSIANVNKAWDAFESKYPKSMAMKHEMTETWTPQPEIVSPGNDATHSAPSDAIILFDGSNLNQWTSSKGGEAKWNVHDGVFTVNKKAGDILTKQSFGSFQMHIEWQIPVGITGSSQARGNSGIKIANRYELQILDNYDNETYVNGQCGSIYKQTAPLVNACKKPGEWNSYDIVYTAPVFKADGTYLYRPRITVFQNGVLVQNNVEILGITEYIGLPKVEKHGDAPIQLQAHGDASLPISFRNIWIRKL